MQTNIYILNKNIEFSYKDHNIIIKHENLMQKIPIKSVSSIQIFADIALDTKVIRAALQHRIPIYFIAHKGKYLGKLNNIQNFAIENRLHQYQIYFDQTKKLTLAKKIIFGKIDNSLHMLYRLRRLRGYLLTEEINQIIRNQQLAQEAKDLESLRGYEGIVAKYYFQGLGKTLPTPFSFLTRTRQPPLDPTNSMLSFGYTLLANSIMTALETNGLDAYIGFIHASIRNNPALVLDMMEEFRAIIVDHIVIGLIESKKISSEDFEHLPEQLPRPVLMKENAKKQLIAAYEKRLLTKVAYDNSTETFIKIINYQAQKLKKAIKQDLNYQPFSFR